MADRLIRMLRDLKAGTAAARPIVPSPIAIAAEVMARAEPLLLDVRRARVVLNAVKNTPGVDPAERAVYLVMLKSFERGLLAAVEGIIAELRKRRGEGEADAEAWLRRRLREFRKER